MEPQLSFYKGSSVGYALPILDYNGEVKGILSFNKVYAGNDCYNLLIRLNSGVGDTKVSLPICQKEQLNEIIRGLSEACKLLADKEVDIGG